MKRQLSAAEFKYYNANSRGKNVGDCVKRSMSLALGLSYNEVGKLLVAKMKELHYSNWNIRPVFQPIIEEATGASRKEVSDKITVAEFADSVVDPNKIYLLTCGKNPGTSSHMVCIRDGKIWDSWNCSDYFVDLYWEITNVNNQSLNYTTQEFMLQMTRDYAAPIVREQIISYAKKHKWDCKSIEIRPVANRYKIELFCYLRLNRDDIITKERRYSFKIAIVCEPTLSSDEIVEFVSKTAKQKAYDKMWTVNEQEKKLLEAYKVAHEAGIEEFYEDTYWMSASEQKFINTLPGWIKPLITYVSIDKPGVYSNSYHLSIKPHPDDDRHDNKLRITFEASTADEIKEQIDRYYEYWDIPFDDYDPSDM